jgi:hypothetical protein
MTPPPVGRYEKPYFLLEVRFFSFRILFRKIMKNFNKIAKLSTQKYDMIISS